MLYKILLFCFGVYVFYSVASWIWLKFHPKYDLTFIAAEIGSGKTCYAAKIARKYLRMGWQVYSNDYIAGCGCLNVDDLKTKCCPENSLIIIDEASLEMNSRKFATISISLIEYFKLCRHYKNKVILISQTFGDTDKQIRDLAARVYFIRPIFGDAFPGFLSMPVRVRGKLGIGIDGQPTMQYKIGRFGVPYFLPKYYKYFKSFSRKFRPIIPFVSWDDIGKREDGVLGGSAPSGPPPYLT